MSSLPSRLNDDTSSTSVNALTPPLPRSEFAAREEGSPDAPDVYYFRDVLENYTREYYSAGFHFNPACVRRVKALSEKLKGVAPRLPFGVREKITAALEAGGAIPRELLESVLYELEKKAGM